MLAQVAEQAGPLADHHQQAAPRSVVLLVRAHVLVQLINASREQSDLHFRRSGVVGITAELVDDLRLAVLGNRHLNPHRLRLLRLLLYEKLFPPITPTCYQSGERLQGANELDGWRGRSRSAQRV